MADRPSGLSAVEFLSGWIGGSAGILASHPLDVVRVRLQSMRVARDARAPSIGSVLGSLWRDDGGPRGLMRGIFSPLVVEGAWKAVVFSGFNMASGWLQPAEQAGDPPRALPYGRHAVASACGGFLGCFISTPMETVKCRLQVARMGTGAALPSLADEVRAGAAIWRTQGVAGLYRGFWYSALAACPSYAVWFPLNDVLLRALDAALSGAGGGGGGGGGGDRGPPPQLGVPEQLLCGAVSGGISWVVAFPGDKLKAIIMTEDRKRLAGGHWPCFRARWAEGGQRWLWRGLGATVLRGLPQCAFTMLGYNKAKEMFQGTTQRAGEQ